MSDYLSLLQTKSKDELIEELLATKKQLREFKDQMISKQLFIEISKTVPTAVCEMDCSMRIKHINPATEKMFGVTIQECVGKLVTDFIHPQDRYRVREDAVKIFQGDFWNPKVYNALKVDGTEFRIVVVSSPILEGATPTGIRSYLLDFNAYKEAEEMKLQSATKETEQAYQLIDELKREIREYTTFGGIVSRNPKMKEIFEFVKTIADVPSTVLITGENGSGKELIARNIHREGVRRTKPMVVVNCGALPETLLESELFGYKAGAFTDAKKDKKGKFVLADGGTIFLDEIGDLPFSMQVKILRVLQEKTVTPLGSNEEIQVNVRVIAATNRNLENMIRKNLFREDLYFRLKVLLIKVPPLRERRCDIPLLCDHFINHFNTILKRSVSSISDDAMKLLMTYDFPGNIRELQHIIEHACIFCKGKEIDINCFPEDFYSGIRTQPEKISEQTEGHADEPTLASTVSDREKQTLMNAIIKAGGNKTLAAEKLGIHKSTLFRKLKKYGMALGAVFEEMQWIQKDS